MKENNIELMDYSNLNKQIANLYLPDKVMIKIFLYINSRGLRDFMFQKVDRNWHDETGRNKEDMILLEFMFSKKFQINFTPK